MSQKLMRNPDDVVVAKLAVANQLARPDIGRSDQRAFLRGMLAALSWVEGANVRVDGDVLALQRLVDGQDVNACNGAKMSNVPMGPLSTRQLKTSLIKGV